MSGKKIHLIGIGGVGMAGLAILLKRRGNEVSGCDLSASPRMRWLEANGVKVSVGHDVAHLEGVDEVIATPAVHRGNSELDAAKGVRSRGETLAALVNEAADSIVVCGSHGKTTTSTYIAKLLMALGEKVEWCIGGETGDFPVAGGDGGVLVVEGDESDGTLALYHAKTLVITNVEYDHPDHFPTPADYEACFETAAKNAVTVLRGDEVMGDDPNRAMAIRVALGRGHALADIERALPAVTAALPDRRFQEIEPGVYIDYAHHPTEIRYTLARARKLTAGSLRVLFQPHRYSRTKSLKKEFARALAMADEVVLCPTYGAFEAPIEGGDTADLYAEMRSAAGCRIHLARSCEEAWTHAMRVRRDGDLTFVLGAGDIIAHLRELPAERIWIGAGSNTWKSDLDMPVEYVRTEGPAKTAGCQAEVAPGVPLLEVAPWMAGIPGTIGGWVKMNAGAFGHSISEIIDEVKVDGEWRPASACGFAYRHSSIDGEIQEVKWKGGKVEKWNGGEVEKWSGGEEYLARRKKFPAGTYGSFFKNPEGDSAGRLLEEAGAKKLRVGGAYVWEEHANVIVRGEGCTASDVLALATLMRNAVFFRFGIRLEPEVCGIQLPFMKETASTGLSRRETLKGVALFAAADKLTDGGFEPVSYPGRPERETPVLPPGARRDFRERCIACGLCIADCPEHIIRPSVKLSTFGQPELDFRKGHCILGCVKCSQICPVDAFTPLQREMKPNVKIGLAVWKKDLCVRTVNGDPCTVCVRKCPVQAVHIVKGFPVVDAGKCIGCGACEHTCPARPMPAISVKGFKEQRKVQAMSENDLIAEMRALVDGGKALVVARDGVIVRQLEGRGIRPIVDLYSREVAVLSGALVCDKIVGRAAAAFYVKAGSAKVIAKVMTRGAAEMLRQAGIEPVAEQLVESIVNREKTGICPMEKVIENETDTERMIANCIQLAEKLK